MSLQANEQRRVELRDGHGSLLRVFVPLEEADRLRAELDEARSQVAALERQLSQVGAERDAYERTTRRLLQQRIPPLTETEVAEMRTWPFRSVEEFLAEAEEFLRSQPTRG